MNLKKKIEFVYFPPFYDPQSINFDDFNRFFSKKDVFFSDKFDFLSKSIIKIIEQLHGEVHKFKFPTSERSKEITGPVTNPAGHPAYTGKKKIAA